MSLELKLASTQEKARGSFGAGALSCYWLPSNGVLQSMDLPSRSRASHAVRHVCPAWTWPADELIHIRDMAEPTPVRESLLRNSEYLALPPSSNAPTRTQLPYHNTPF